MVALPKNQPAYILPFDVIQRRIDDRREAARVRAHTMTRRAPLASSPLLPWLLHQEALYRAQVAESQPTHTYTQPEYHTYHLKRGELPHNFLGNLIWRGVSFIGSFFDALSAAHA